MRIVIAAILMLCVGAAQAQTHPCARDAIARGAPLLRLHFEVKPDEKLENFGIDDKVKVLPPVGALKGKGKFDVLEVWGYIYKASYRMRFIYAQTKGCVLMGQEILEASDPY